MTKELWITIFIWIIPLLTVVVPIFYERASERWKAKPKKGTKRSKKIVWSYRFSLFLIAALCASTIVQTLLQKSIQDEKDKYSEREPLVNFYDKTDAIVLDSIKPLTYNGIVLDDYFFTVKITSFSADAYNVDVKVMGAVLTDKDSLMIATDTIKFTGGNSSLPQGSIYGSRDASFASNQKMKTLYFMLYGHYENSKGRNLTSLEFLYYDPLTKLPGKPSPKDIANLKKFFKVDESIYYR